MKSQSTCSSAGKAPPYINDYGLIPGCNTDGEGFGQGVCGPGCLSIYESKRRIRRNNNNMKANNHLQQLKALCRATFLSQLAMQSTTSPKMIGSSPGLGYPLRSVIGITPLQDFISKVFWHYARLPKVESLKFLFFPLLENLKLLVRLLISLHGKKYNPNRCKPFNTNDVSVNTNHKKYSKLS